jgi:sporulation protein YlmC with PRC-barrel domain
VKSQMATTAAAVLLSLVPALAETQANPNETLPGVSVVPGPAESLAASTSSILASQSAGAGTNVDLNVHFLSRQMPDDLLVSDLLGRPAVDTENDTIGDVNDLVIDSSGKAIAAVIGVGGFLGIGQKDVAIPFEDLKFTRDDNNDVKIEVDINKEALKSAPDYQSLDEQEIVEGANKGQNADKTRTY